MQRTKTYSCPMHPEIKQDKAGTCPNCGMRLVQVNSEGKTTARQNEAKTLGTSTWKDYVPLAIIISLILVTSLIISLSDFEAGSFSTTAALS
ncbi:MAG: heavy metal-binding domain-containing protein, partial [Nitrososphaeraceae archaeon]